MFSVTNARANKTKNGHWETDANILQSFVLNYTLWNCFVSVITLSNINEIG